ncbi:MAG: nucleoside recognition domain-containing protein [Paludibacter sp.]
MNAIAKRIYNSTLSAFPKAGKTIWWLLKIIIPISLFVSFLQYYGVITQIAIVLKPIFSVVGLPGESAVVFISSFFLPLYGPIAIISTLPLSIREITILALMCLISHNLLVETAIQKKTGSSFIIMLSLRLLASLSGAFVLNLLLPANPGANHIVQKSIEFGSLGDMLLNWVQNSGYLSIKIALIISGLMILQSILKEFNILNIVSKIFAPLMRMMGLSDESSFLWFVAQTLGLTYGSAVMIEEVNNKEISRESANLLNYHIAINHSLLEDTLLFVAIGVPAGWIIAPRFLMAIIVVWSVRGIMKFKKKSKVLSQLSNEAI